MGQEPTRRDTVEPTQHRSRARDHTRPAVRIATTGNPAGTTIHTDIADVLLEAYRAAVAGSPPAATSR